MKKFLLFLCLICALYGLSWGGGLGESTEGTLTPATWSYVTNCDSARLHFGYPSSNLYYSIKLFPLVEDSSQLFRDSLDLDSIGGHYVEARIYERGAATPKYSLALWEHKADNSKLEDIWDATEPDRNRLNLYVSTSGSDDSSGLTWQSAVLTLQAANSKCTGADEYYIYVAPGTYKDVEVYCTTGNIHWIGSGVGQTKVWGVVEPLPAFPAKYIIRVATTSDSGAIEITGFEFHGYEATSGVEDSATYQCLKINEPTAGIWIHDNYFYNFYEAIFLCSSTRKAIVEKNWIGKPINKGLVIGGGFEHLILDNVIDSVQDDRMGIYSTAGQAPVVYRGNVINAVGGRATHCTALSKGNIFVENFIRAVVADSAFEDLSGNNVYIGNHIESQIGTGYTNEEDIYYAPRSANSDSGYTAGLGNNLGLAFQDTNSGGDVIFDLGGLYVRASGNDTAFIAIGAGSGGGVFFKSGATGLYGFKTIAVPNGGRGIEAYGHAAGIWSQGSLSGMRLEGIDAFLINGTDYGILATGGGAGISAVGSGSGGHGFVARGDTTYSGGHDINLTGDGLIHGNMTGLQNYFGAGDGWYKILWPRDGSANKDSVQIYDSGDNLISTWIFHHANTESVIDTIDYDEH